MKNLIFASFLFIISSVTVSAFAETDNSVEKPEQANFVIYRPKDNSAVNFRVIVDGKHWGKLKAGSSIQLHLSAGTHVISANDSRLTQLEVDVDGEHVVYIRKEIDRKSRPSFTVVDATDDIAAKFAASNNVAWIN